MSWHGPSAPRVEGIATKSRVVAKLRIEGRIDGVENFLIGCPWRSLRWCSLLGRWNPIKA